MIGKMLIESLGVYLPARIVSTDDRLSLIALETGFADQSHMTRAVGWLTGKSPSAWRRGH